jgi:DNA-binding NarL/FixJ family response regulator
MDPGHVHPQFVQPLMTHLAQPADQTHQAQAAVRQRILRYIALILNILLVATAQILQQQIPPSAREPYHTSALTGQEWVIELITGHPERIRCELGVNAHVFASLINDLRDLGHTDSRYVLLEEQLAIFLYTCVTGLTVRHVGERFQRSNATISKYVISCMSYTSAYSAY